MATATSRAHLINRLKPRAVSSPSDQEFATASLFDPVNDAVIHSTMQLPDNTTQQPLPQYSSQPLDDDHFSDDGSEGSAEMSIELGRGVKRNARDPDEDISSPMLFDAGNGSFYEVTSTPPIRPRDSQRKTGDGLRRQASLRHATETAKGNESLKRAKSTKQRSLSQVLKQINADEEVSLVGEDPAQVTSTFNARNTRFARSQQAATNISTRVASAPAHLTPVKGNSNNPTAQSNSFMLPELPNIKELVSGVRKDGTPVFNRDARSRSRFTSGSYKPRREGHYPIENVPVPEEEKAIYASLQLLKDRVDQLEMDKSEAQKREEEYENEISLLRNQLAVADRRPDSALGSDEEASGQEKWNKEKKKLQANIKALQERIDRSERKFSISEIAVKRVTKERDELLSQVGVAYYTQEELKAEVEELRETASKFKTEHQDLKEEIDALRKENQDLRLLMAQTQASYDQETQRRENRVMESGEKKLTSAYGTSAPSHGHPAAKSRSHTKLDGAVKGKNEGRKSKPKSVGDIDDLPEGDLATRIAQQVQKQRIAALADAHRHRVAGQQQGGSSHSRSESTVHQQSIGAERRASFSNRPASVPVQADASDVESTTQLDFSRAAQNTPKIANPTATVTGAASTREEDSKDLTLISWQDPREVIKMRKTIEEERKANKARRSVSAPVEKETTHQGLFPLKSSLKDAANGDENVTGRLSTAAREKIDEFIKHAKSVRVLSPHSSAEHSYAHPSAQSEPGDTSVLSNTSRRRSRVANDSEGMTSEFILPDITFGGNKKSGPSFLLSDENIAAAVAAASSASNDTTIPTPIPVTERDIDVTDATMRPAQEPPIALATVIKSLQDEIRALKLQLVAQTRLYNQHDPAISKRRRQDIKALMERLTAEIEKRSDQVYALYDVLEGQKEDVSKDEEEEDEDIDEEVGKKV